VDTKFCLLDKKNCFGTWFEVLQPNNLKDNEFIETQKVINPDI
jgi:hypothetical protein